MYGGATFVIPYIILFLSIYQVNNKAIENIHVYTDIANSITSTDWIFVRNIDWKYETVY